MVRLEKPYTLGDMMKLCSRCAKKKQEEDEVQLMILRANAEYGDKDAIAELKFSMSKDGKWIDENLEDR